MPNGLTVLLKQPSTTLQYLVVVCMGLVGILQGVLSTNVKDKETYAINFEFWLRQVRRPGRHLNQTHPTGIFSGFTDKLKDFSFMDTDALRVVACLPCHKPPSIS